MWFFSSYAPLWLMLGLRFDRAALQIPLVALSVLSAGLVMFLLRRRHSERASNTTLTISGDAGAEVSGYLAAYLLPFLTVDDPDGWDLSAYVLFLAVAGLVYVRSGLVQINPTVYVMRRKVFKATTPVDGGKKHVFVISARDLRVGETLKGERFADRVFIDHAGAP